MKKVKLIEQVEFYYAQIHWIENQIQKFERIWKKKDFEFDQIAQDKLLKVKFANVTVSDSEKLVHLKKIHEELNESGLKKLANTVSVAKKRSKITREKRVELKLDDSIARDLKIKAEKENLTQSEVVTEALKIRAYIKNVASWDIEPHPNPELREIYRQILKEALE